MKQREIRFNAWDKKNKRMLHNVSTGTITIWDNEKKAESKDCIFLQYFGLKDSVGVKVFEGDILQIGENPKNVDVFKEFYQSNDWERISFQQGIKVIGNIYEDFKLLK